MKLLKYKALISTPQRPLLYPFICRNLVLLDPDWAWCKQNKARYGCSSSSEFVRKLIKAEMLAPRDQLIRDLGKIEKA